MYSYLYYIFSVREAPTRLLIRQGDTVLGDRVEVRFNFILNFYIFLVHNITRLLSGRALLYMEDLSVFTIDVAQ